MVRIAVLSDIHGNLPALEAALDDVRATAPDQVIVNGDIINRGPQSVECLQAVRAQGWPVVFGNHEEYALKRLNGEVPEPWNTRFWEPFQRVAEALSEDEIAYLRALPRDFVVEEPNLPVLRIVHGSMRALNDALGPWMSDAELLEAVDGAPEPIVIGAHSHRTFERRVEGHRLLNSGSVGAPFNGDPRAQYLLMTATNGEWKAEFRGVAYDRVPVYAAWARSGELERCMSAQVFKYEVEMATFHLGAYVRFCERRGLDLNEGVSFERYRAATQNVPPGRSLKGHRKSCPD
jgi:predicted phosphodiesterase